MRRAHRAFGFTLPEYIKQHTINDGGGARDCTAEIRRPRSASSSLKAAHRWVVFLRQERRRLPAAGPARVTRRPADPSAAGGKQWTEHIVAQDNFPVQVTSPPAAGALLFERMSCSERLSEPYHIDVSVVSEG